MPSPKAYILAGDIGGTNSRLSLYSVTPTSMSAREKDIGEEHEQVYSASYKNVAYKTFTAVLEDFVHNCRDTLEDQHLQIATGCLAVAGPVMDNCVSLTNIEWVINADELALDVGVGAIELVNDFVANGYGLLTLTPSERTTVQDVEATTNAPIALIGAGTGLGECYLTADKKGRYDAHPSEGGHVEFGPCNDIDAQLLGFLQKRFSGRVSAERIISGKGLVNVYMFLRDAFPADVDARHDKRILEADEGGKEIGALAYDYGLARRALDIMMTAYGQEAGNCGLKFLPYGGLYIAGGIAPKNSEYIVGNDSLFMRAFRAKGRVSAALDRVPVHIVKSENLGLRGAHVVAFRLLQDAAAATGAGTDVDKLNVAQVRAASRHNSNASADGVSRVSGAVAAAAAAAAAATDTAQMNTRPTTGTAVANGGVVGSGGGGTSEEIQRLMLLTTLAALAVAAASIFKR